MKRFRTLAPLLLAISIALAAPASAAPPEKDHVAVGATLGLLVPYENDYKLGFDLAASLDYYLSDAFGVRGTLGWNRTESKSGDHPSASTGMLLVSGVYDWPMGTLHPHALAGIGLYTISPAYGGSTVRVGAHAGAGVDYFLDRRTAIVGEGVFHFVGSVADQKQGFFSLNAGVRYYF